LHQFEELHAMHTADRDRLRNWALTGCSSAPKLQQCRTARVIDWPRHGR
jgi:hypothetical protein